MVEGRVEHMPVRTSNERTYLERLRQCVRSSLTSDGLPLSRVVRVAGGAYPTDVRDVLQKMISAREVIRENETYRLSAQCPGQMIYQWQVACQETNSAANEILSQVNLAEPHPADYDWRFTSSAL